MKVGLQIVLGAVLLACILGVAMDLVTAHVAVEYFTVYHPKVVESTEPIVMALVWGVGASWWFGLIAGIILASVNARLRPSLGAKRVLMAVARACLYLWITILLVLVGAYGLASWVPEDARRSTFESDRRLMAVAIAHMTEYVLGGVATIVLAFRIRWLSRRSVFHVPAS